MFYGAINRTCMDFSRSNTHCLGTKPWAEQFNEATAFIDGSQIYGSTIEDQKALRKGQDGLLATHSTLNEFLPSKKDLGKKEPLYLLTLRNEVVIEKSNGHKPKCKRISRNFCTFLDSIALCMTNQDIYIFFCGRARPLILSFRKIFLFFLCVALWQA